MHPFGGARVRAGVGFQAFDASARLLEILARHFQQLAQISGLRQSLCAVEAREAQLLLEILDVFDDLTAMKTSVDNVESGVQRN
ncbi:hypothetical protein [Lentzea nigeriaca]|uniref:hypothetical protein n=1 Tax=Lentzea nigeriaca TaxID=1128665 RepID=UPI00195DA1EB|nr:hypothetical protein [Lentzea nigeriaca]MBM7860307.1 hypothetical protein [Lentzea nigeriaca]